MLVQFSVENFKSIREEQTLSMVASNYEKDHPENVIELDVPGMKGVNLLKTAVIYGANASGKSNLLQAMDYFRYFILNSGRNGLGANRTGTKPYLLDTMSRDKPTTFHVTLIIANGRVDYGFSINSERVVEEWLRGYPKGKPVNYFHRRLEDGQQKIDLSSSYKRELENILNVKDHTLIITLPSILDIKNEAVHDTFGWAVDNMINLNIQSSSDQTQIRAYENIEIKLKVLELLKKADLGIVGLDFGFEIKGDHKYLFTNFAHRVEGTSSKVQSISWGKEHESAGTMRYFNLIGPIIDVLNNGSLGCLDELDSSIHPLLAKSIVELFHERKQNKLNAQLIFTTHDTTLLSTGIFRRDQVWYTEKRYEGNTVLYSLAEFKPRKGEAIQRGYLAGRYGAIPFFGSKIETDG